MVEGYSSSINLTENLGLVSTEAFHQTENLGLVSTEAFYQNVPLQNLKK